MYGFICWEKFEMLEKASRFANFTLLYDLIEQVIDHTRITDL